MATGVFFLEEFLDPKMSLNAGEVLTAAMDVLERIFDEDAPDNDDDSSYSEIEELLLKLLRHLLEMTMNSGQAYDISRHANFPFFVQLSIDYATRVQDERFVHLAGTLMSNLCVYEECRPLLPGTLFTEFFLLAIESFPTRKRVLHLNLMAISNSALCAGLELNETLARRIASAVVPQWGEPPVIEAWACALLNIAASGEANLAQLLQTDAVKTLERLIVFHGADDRVIPRGLQCLAWLSAPFFRKAASPTGSSP